MSHLEQTLRTARLLKLFTVKQDFIDFYIQREFVAIVEMARHIDLKHFHSLMTEILY